MKICSSTSSAMCSLSLRSPKCFSVGECSKCVCPHCGILLSNKPVCEVASGNFSGIILGERNQLENTAYYVSLCNKVKEQSTGAGSRPVMARPVWTGKECTGEFQEVECSLPWVSDRLHESIYESQCKQQNTTKKISISFIMIIVFQLYFCLSYCWISTWKSSRQWLFRICNELSNTKWNHGFS